MIQRILSRFCLSALVGVLCLPALPQQTVQAQRDYFRLAQRYERPQICYQSVVLPGSEDTGRLGITFRIPHTALVFTKTPRDNPRGGFVANVEVVVEIFQDSNRIDTRLLREEHYVSTYEDTQARTQDLTGGVWFDLPPGTYTYRFEVTDRNTESERSPHSPQTSRITIPEASDAQVHQTILTRRIDTTAMGRLIEPHNLSGDFVFGTPAAAVTPLVVPADNPRDDTSVRYALRKLDSESLGSVIRRREFSHYRPEISAAEEDGISAQGTVVRKDSVVLSELLHVDRFTGPDSTGTELAVRMQSNAHESSIFALVVDLHGEQLTNDVYAFDVEWTDADGETHARTTRFAAHWRDMPVSLYDLDVAIDNLSYIADEKTIDFIDDGDREERFREFWKKRDPSPETPYNELMAEYYERVDYAADQFRTGRSPAPDGLRSDRARIYIVNGPPASKERTIPRRGIVRETWTYDDGRTYVFEASSGFDTFRLVDEKS